MSAILDYLKEIEKEFSSGHATEHSYRPALKNLLQALCPGIDAVNEPKRSEVGAPDFILYDHNTGIPIAYVEAKDIGGSLLDRRNKEQLDRYRSAFANLIITDYLDFHFYLDGNLLKTLRIGRENGLRINKHAENFEELINLLNDFVRRPGQSITNPETLAKLMAGKAKVLADVLSKAINSDVDNNRSSELANQMQAFKEILLHQITPNEFADLYAQTIAYGLFAARIHCDDPKAFSRRDAGSQIPLRNPFLRKLFEHIAGTNLDIRIDWIVETLVDVFRSTNIREVLNNFGYRKGLQDPIIHFYETFLGAFDPNLRKSRGVWYTPEPVVKFMVRAVDELLKSEFGLKSGLADNSKIETFSNHAITEDKKRVSNPKNELQHRVQILDPATGTGTFLAEVLRHIHRTFKSQKGQWNSYVEKHLLPRMLGFELLMASYAMAHLKLDLVLDETGYKSTHAGQDERIRIYLTNSLEESYPDSNVLLAKWLSDEANEASAVKRDKPIMVIIGNPPYSGDSSNKIPYINSLINDYKFDNFSGSKITDPNPKWLNNDYIKFTRWAESLIVKKGDGILCFITPNSYLDSIILRGMRTHLLKSFNQIYIINLHGSSKKSNLKHRELNDKNVFDITEGVAISIFIKTNARLPVTASKVLYREIVGPREYKFDLLEKDTLDLKQFIDVNLLGPNYFFMPTNTTNADEYNSGFSLSELMPVHGTGVLTAKDHLVIKFDDNILSSNIQDFLSEKYSDEQIRVSFFKEKKTGKHMRGDSHNFSVSKARRDYKNINVRQYIDQISYRPFDNRYIFYHEYFIEGPRFDLMSSLRHKLSIALVVCKQISSQEWEHVWISEFITDDCLVSNRTKERGYVFPLFIYTNETISFGSSLTPNLNMNTVNDISRKLGTTFSINTSSVDNEQSVLTPLNLMDYIYAILNSRNYRSKFNEFLKIGFPIIPYPKSSNQFFELADLGRELKEIHLMKSDSLDIPITNYSVSGNNFIEQIFYDSVEIDNRLFINSQQFFGNVPSNVWEFSIGGYQPAQKWLKDRKGYTLSYEDIRHYQRIIVAIAKTIETMEAIDQVGVN